MAMRYSLFSRWIRYNIYKILPAILYPIALKITYQQIHKKKLNLKSPKQFSEKLQYLKLNDNSELKTLLTDKIESKKIVKKLVPEINVAQIYQIGTKFEDINFNNLPKSFIIKTNHSCKTNIVINNKKLLTPYKKKIIGKYYNYALTQNYAFESGYELQYKDIKPKIYIEELLKEKNTKLKEHEILCFNGIPKFISNSYYRLNPEINIVHMWTDFYDTNWNLQDFEIHIPAKKEYVPKPSYLEQMLEYASILSKGFKFVRIDFAVILQKIYFMEMTFTPGSGYTKIKPEKYEFILGDMIQL